MGLIAINTAVGIGLFIGLLVIWQKRRHVKDAKTYRYCYQQLVAILDRTTKKANAIELLSGKMLDSVVFEYYESTLKLLETLLEAMGKVTPFGVDPSSLDSALFLARDCEQRIARLEAAYTESLAGRIVDYEMLTEKRRRESTIEKLVGCYFCSRPFMEERFSQVRVRLEGEIKQVMSCAVCKEELETTKKVKVLYFMKDGKPIHWSEVADYQPSEDYWEINRKKLVRKMPKLELVPNISPEDSSNSPK